MFVISLRVVYALYVQSQIGFADLLHGWPSTVGDDIHFLPTKELNFPMHVTSRLLKLSQKDAAKTSGGTACFGPFAACVNFVCHKTFLCIAFITCCHEIHLAVAKLGVTVSSNSVRSFEAKDARKYENVKPLINHRFGWSVWELSFPVIRSDWPNQTNRPRPMYRCGNGSVLYYDGLSNHWRTGFSMGAAVDHLKRSPWRYILRYLT